LEAWQKDSLLTRLDAAFSRDQANKIYVQDRMLEKASGLWAWLEGGAHFYVCGDAALMARDVEAALHEVCRSAGGMTAEAAAAYVGKMKTDKRYCRDVY
jgi:sulfite reductase (NADPH) flavoprotein alpha-component